MINAKRRLQASFFVYDVVHANPYVIALFHVRSDHYLHRAGAGQLATQGRAYIVTMETKTHSASAFPNICKIRLKCNGSRSPSLQTVLCLPEAEGYTRVTYHRSARRISAGVCFRTLPAFGYIERYHMEKCLCRTQPFQQTGAQHGAGGKNQRQRHQVAEGKTSVCH